MKRLLGITALILLTFPYFLGCKPFSSGNDDFDDYQSGEVQSDIRVITGTLYEEVISVTPSFRGATVVRYVAAADTKVTAAYDDSIFTFTNASGAFSLSVDLIKNAKAGNTNYVSSSSQAIALIAQKVVKNPDGSQNLKSTSISVDFGTDLTRNEKTIDISKTYQSSNASEPNSRTCIKTTPVSEFLVIFGGKPEKVEISFYDLFSNALIYKASTSSDGRLSLPASPGTYRLIISVSGYKPTVIFPHIISAEAAGLIEFDIPKISLTDSSSIGSDSAPVASTTTTPVNIPSVSAEPVPPELTVKVNDRSVEKNEKIKLLQGATMSVSLSAYDADKGLGDMFAQMNGVTQFEIHERNQTSLSGSFQKVFYSPGTFSLRITARDYDFPKAFSPSRAGYLKIKILPATNKTLYKIVPGVRVTSSDGSIKFNDLITYNESEESCGRLMIPVTPDDRVTPFIRVDMEDHQVSGVPRVYDRFYGDFDETVRVPVSRDSLSSGAATIWFEECRGNDPWSDWGMDSYGMKIWFMEDKDTYDTYPLVETLRVYDHSVSHDFTVEVQPIVVTRGKIAGVVIDEISGEPVSGAMVLISGTEISTMTNTEGHFEFIGLKAGTYNLIVTGNNYATKTFSDITVP
ncbi:MAG: carboxypeptidase-like regulatory domain-containing protein [Candidatus Riflebacteria bacterium]|nr:carboxypeptidase-like regulatory domain-containing protein [Candidatus Riflebacteria bacterium]